MKGPSPTSLVLQDGRALVAATYGTAAVQAGADILNSGGTAADAVVATAIAQIALCGGAWDSLAGILGFLHYDAATSSVSSLNAGFDTVLDEHDPLSIPRSGSGRSVLVPGFPAGIAAVHRRFGALPFARLFDAAIAITEGGFPIAKDFATVLHYRRRFLARLAPDTFVRDGGLLRQPQLAHTLRNLARQGAGYMYEGRWAERFLNAVTHRGGRISAQDLRNYQPSWMDAVRTTFRGCDVYASGPPAVGGVYLVEALNIVDALSIDSEHYTKHPDSLFWLMQATHARYFHHAPAPEDRAQKDSAVNVAHQIRHRHGFTYLDALMIQNEAHSDAVVCVDRLGNVAALSHSINTVLWGKLGLFVDGVSIPDSGSFQQAELARLGPGVRLPDAMNPVLALRHGQPVFASACAGAGLHEVTLQMLLNTLLYGMDLETACRAPLFLQPAWTGLFRLTASNRKPWAQIGNRLFDGVINVALRLYPATKPLANVHQLVPHGQFSPEVLRAVRRKGQKCKLFGKRHAPSFWAGVHLDPQSGNIVGATRSAMKCNDVSRSGPAS